VVTVFGVALLAIWLARQVRGGRPVTGRSVLRSSPK
jgi:hypothetical protein